MSGQSALSTVMDSASYSDTSYLFLFGSGPPLAACGLQQVHEPFIYGLQAEHMKTVCYAARGEHKVNEEKKERVKE